MATLYNKTALNKIKKADLIQMFLDQQAKLNDKSLDGWTATLEEYKMLKVENKKLKEDLNDLKEQFEQYQNSVEESLKMCDFDESEPIEDAVKSIVEENKELNSLVSEYKDSSLIHCDAEPHEILESMEEYEEAIETRDDQIEELKKQNDYAYKQINELMSKVTLLSTD
jgi:regulator of replication initiation timing